MDFTQQPLVSDEEIQQLLNSSVPQTHGHMNSNQFASSGEHPSELIGTGMDFADRQPYQRGDDPRFIDWRASARSQHTLVRRYHAEISAPSCIVIDRRTSMLFGTDTRLKATQAVRVGIQCGAQLLKTGQQVASLILDEQPYWQSATNRLAEFSATAKLAARPSPPTFQSSSNHWSLISDLINQKLTQGSRLILISDFKGEQQHQLSDAKSLRYLSQHYNLTLMQISDKNEHSIQQSGINLNNGSKLTAIKNKHDLKQFNNSLNEFNGQFKSQIDSLKCTHHHIFTHDDISNLSVF